MDARYFFNHFWRDHKTGIYDVAHIVHYLPSFYIELCGSTKYLHGFYYQDYNRIVRELFVPLNQRSYHREDGHPVYHCTDLGTSVRLKRKQIPVLFSIDATNAVHVYLDEPYILFGFTFKAFLSIYSGYFLKSGLPLRHEEYLSYLGCLAAFEYDHNSPRCQATPASLAFFLDCQTSIHPDFCGAKKLMYMQPGRSYNFYRAFQTGLLQAMLYAPFSRFFCTNVPMLTVEINDPREIFLREAFFAFSDTVGRSFCQELKRSHAKCFNDRTFHTFDSLVIRNDMSNV